MSEFVSRPDEILLRTRPNFHTWISLAAVAVLATFSALWIVQDRLQAEHAQVVSREVTIWKASSPVATTVFGTVKQLFVKPGESVKAGQALAMIDSPALTAAVQNAKQAVVVAQAQAQATQAAVLPPPVMGSLSNQAAPNLAPIPSLPLPKSSHPPVVQSPAKRDSMTQARERASSLVTQLQATVLLASDKVKIAQADLVSATEQGAAVKSGLDQLQSNLDQAKSNRDKYQSLYTDGIISRAEFQRKQAEVDIAQSALDAAKKQSAADDDLIKLRQADVDSNQKLLASLQGQLADAQNKLSSLPQPVSAKAPAPLVPEVGPLTVTPPVVSQPVVRVPVVPPPVVPLGVAFSPQANAAAQAHLAKLQQILLDAEKALAATEIRAPADGIVGAIKRGVGQIVSRGDAITSIGHPESSVLIVRVPRSEASRVRIGQPCQIVLAADSQRRFSGLVSGFQRSNSFDAEILVKPAPSSVPLLSLPPGTALSAQIDTRRP